MSEPAIKTYADFILPPSVVSKIDVSRLVNEVERVDVEMTTATVRAKTGSYQQVAPTMSDQLVDFLNQNRITLNDSHDRANLIKLLRQLKDHVPIINMTFTVEADRESLQQLVQWLRTSVHRQAVIAVGLQPAMIAGVYLRTPNRVHDLSLRGALEGSQDLLIKELRSLSGRK